MLMSGSRGNYALHPEGIAAFEAQAVQNLHVQAMEQARVYHEGRRPSGQSTLELLVGPNNVSKG